MSFPGFIPKNHPQQVGVRGALDSVDDRATTPEVFAQIEAEHGPFTIDVAASDENAKCERYYTRDDDGLAQPWSAEAVFGNPPYSNIRPWVEKAWAEAPAARTIVLLVPADRTEQGWWQDLVEPFRDRPGSLLSVEFLRGRLRFLRPGETEVPPNSRPPFGCCLLIWRCSRPPPPPPPPPPEPTLFDD